jgi:hypothetical protein
MSKTWDELLKISPDLFSEQELNLIYDIFNLIIRARNINEEDKQ